MSKRKPLFSSLILIILISHLMFLIEGSIKQTDQTAESKVYVVYMGKSPHDDVELITSYHHEILIDVLGSKEASEESMVYSYRHGFSGFAAKLTELQAQKIAESHGAIHVIPNHFYKLHTTRSWDYLGLSPQSPSNLLQDANMGDGTIIGILDTGIWPDHEAFSDKGLGPIPSKWKGTCESGPQFNATKSCNKKIIGACFFVKGYLAEYQKLHNTTKINDSLSPIDENGHGTHTASIASGSFLSNVSYAHGLGLGLGTARGGAPRARLAVYKVCWNLGRCAYADVLKAFDKAIHDGIDILSLSLGLEIPLPPEINRLNAISFASLHAVEKGIVVVCAAGNSGPIAQTVTNTAPWILTVAASTIDRSFPTPILLGNNQTIMGEAIFTGNDTGFRQLIYPEVSPIRPSRYCDTLSPNDTWMAGKVVLCFHSGEDRYITGAILAVQLVGGMGIIVAKNPTKYLDYFTNDFPSVQVSYDAGTKVLNYISSTRNPLARLRPSKAYLGKPVSTKVAHFSSRGPNSIAPAILKPDVAAPGVNILGAFPPEDLNTMGIRHYFLSGTSMATPHVSGIVALLKSLHPQWSPAAIKSAIVTTASTTDSSGEPIFAEGDPMKLADPFDFGGGVINPNKAMDPGLVYDMGITDYVNYLCAMGYKTSSINQMLGRSTLCPHKHLSILDLNLPSITIPSLRKSTTVTRSVSNVGPLNSTYKAIIQPPQGINIRVFPDVLIFNSKVKKISITNTVETNYKVNTGYYFGSLTWTDGNHMVRSPILVRTEFLDFYAF